MDGLGARVQVAGFRFTLGIEFRVEIRGSEGSFVRVLEFGGRTVCQFRLGVLYLELD